MQKPINVLVVEDSDTDTWLLMHELQRNGYQPNHCRVETADDLSQALRQPGWNLVVSDYTMPQFNGSEALKLFIESKLDIPFIFVSGTQGEEAAVTMMKAGASDYIVKGNLSRFVPAVEREMESAEARRIQIQTESAMRHLAAIVKSSQDAIYSMNSDSSIVSWNPAAEIIFGYSAEEIIGRSVAVLFPLGRRDELLETMAYIRRGEVVNIYETERRRKDGKVIPVFLTTSPIKNAAGKVIGASVIARDISKQKQEEEDHLQLIAELTDALSQAKIISGQLPICGTCKRIRDQHDIWWQIETYVASKSNARFVHETCPECADKADANKRGWSWSDVHFGSRVDH
jgi:PAS domain S-box-containing protein